MQRKNGCRICFSRWSEISFGVEQNMNQEKKQKEIKNMERVWKIYTHPLYRECMEKNRHAEEGRVFCGHDLQHFLDVARLAYIFSMERNYGISKEMIYTAAILHDIGKWKQYTEKIPHEKASAQIAEKILVETGFAEEEKARILEAILSHREHSKKQIKAGEGDELSEVLYDADKISRCCFGCQAEPECDWNAEKKNMQIIW